MPHNVLVECRCFSHRCRFTPPGFTEVPRSTQQQHRRDDALEECFSHLTLSTINATPSRNEQPESTRQNRSAAAPQAHAILNQELLGQEARQTMQAVALMRQLHLINTEYEERLRIVESLKDGLRMGESSRTDMKYDVMLLQEHISWMTTAMTNVLNMPIIEDEGLNRQRNYLAEILGQKLNEIKHWESKIFDSRPEPLDAVRHATDETFEVNNEHRFRPSFSSTQPLILFAMLIALILSAVANLADTSSNFLLRMLHSLLKIAIESSSGSKLSPSERTYFLKHLPKDIRTVRSHFNLDPILKVYASCPKCSAIYKPILDKNHKFPIFQTHCTQKEPGALECGAELTKRQIFGNTSIRVPIRPYAYHSIHDFVGELLSRPGLEELLERCPPGARPSTLKDIFDGTAICDFKGSDGTPFFYKNGINSDLHLAWALSVDWFNPLYNKSAGKAISVGVIALVCLNLPLHVRNEKCNMFIAGIIPGPREPSLHQTNHFLRPLIEDLLPAWTAGIWYTRTAKYSSGRRVYSVLVPLVADLPASRKVSGTAGHGSHCFCHLCLVKKDKISNLDVSTFERRTDEEHFKLAREWRDAPSVAQRKTLAKENGIRWSVLFELPYWCPRFIVVDTMHNLFLGLIHYHFRVILGIDFEKASKSRSKNYTVQNVSPKKLKKFLGVLRRGPTSSQLRRFSRADLYAFHLNLNISLPQNAEEVNTTKDDLILSLLCCELATTNKSLAEKDAGHSVAHDVSTLEEALPFCPEIIYQQNTSISTGRSVEHEALTLQGALPDTQNTPASVTSPNIHTEIKRESRSSKNYIGAEEIKLIQAAIRATTRPSWQQGPPSVFGTSQQGKLKADQWRTLLEFDLPVALVEQWTSDKEDDSDSNSNTLAIHSTLLDITMNLALAICWGTSRRTSVQHVAKYTYYMLKYLKGIQGLNPKPKLVPNHHYALHVGEQLLLFGPVNGWWAFPYERLIGMLQKSNTNHQIGQMETTMLKSFYSTSSLQHTIQKMDLPASLKDFIPVIENFFPAHAAGSYGSRIAKESNLTRNISENNTSNSSIAKGGYKEPLDDDIYKALCSEYAAPSRKLPKEVTILKCHFLHGVKYTSREYERDSIIFYSKGSVRRPGIIRKIFLFDKIVIFAVHSYVTLSSDVVDPFKRWPEYRAGLWSQRRTRQVEIIDPEAAELCHAALRPWKIEDINVIREINREY